MTEKSKMAKAKVKAVEEEFGEMSKHRDPASEEEKLSVCSMQTDKNKLKELEVLNSKEAVVPSFDTPIPAKEYDKRKQKGARKNTKQGMDEEMTMN